MGENIKVFKSTEISDTQWAEIAQGYNICFGGERTAQSCKSGFHKGMLGYCLHALKFSEDGKIIGHNYFQPIPYNLNGEKIICALCGGTFVLPEARKDAFIFYDLVTALKKEAKEYGWSAILGVPNENSFKYFVSILKQKHIADLNYYILPITVGKIIKKNIGILNGLSKFYAKIWSAINSMLATLVNTKEINKPLHIELDKDYRQERFKSSAYKKIVNGKYEGTYRIFDEDGVITAYIMDFRENERRSFKSLTKLVRHILKNEKIDAILYVGTMNMKQTLLTKTPHKLIPHQLHLCTSSLDKDNKELSVVLSDIKNIDFGLVNFDVR